MCGVVVALLCKFDFGCNVSVPRSGAFLAEHFMSTSPCADSRLKRKQTALVSSLNESPAKLQRAAEVADVSQMTLGDDEWAIDFAWLQSLSHDTKLDPASLNDTWNES